MHELLHGPVVEPAHAWGVRSVPQGPRGPRDCLLLVQLPLVDPLSSGLGDDRPPSRGAGREQERGPDRHQPADVQVLLSFT